MAYSFHFLPVRVLVDTPGVNMSLASEEGAHDGEAGYATRMMNLHDQKVPLQMAYREAIFMNSTKVDPYQSWQHNVGLDFPWAITDFTYSFTRLPNSPCKNPRSAGAPRLQDWLEAIPQETPTTHGFVLGFAKYNQSSHDTVNP